MQRAAVVGQFGLLGGPTGGLHCPKVADPGLVVHGSLTGKRGKDRCQVAIELRPNLAGMRPLRRDAIGDDEPGVLAEHPAEAEPEIHRHADHQRNIGLLQRL